MFWRFVLLFRFIEHFGNGPGSRITLDTAGNDLGVERRRIYDIINVLESLGCVHREAKNRYIWNTITHLEEKLAALRAAAIAQAAAHAASKLSGVKPRPLHRYDANVVRGAPAPAGSKRAPTGGNRKEKSLGILCQRFIQLFLVAEESVVGLDEAATELSDGSPPPPPTPVAYSALAEPVKDDAMAKYLKTKVRRLYDIANVLTSLQLIEKVSSRTRKPCFRWKGIHNNHALDNLRGKPRHPSAFVQPPVTVSQRQKPISLGSTAQILPPLKRQSGPFSGSGAGSSAAPVLPTSAPKRRKVMPPVVQGKRTDSSVGFSPAAAIEKHMPQEYLTMWRQFLDYASTHGKVDPVEAAEAIAKATKAAADAEKENKAELEQEVGANPALTNSGQPPSFNLERSRPPTVLLPQDRRVERKSGVASTSCESQCEPSREQAPSPSLSHSTPKRLMAAQQLSVLSETYNLVDPSMMPCLPAPSAETPAAQLRRPSASASKTPVPAMSSNKEKKAECVTPGPVLAPLVNLEGNKNEVAQTGRAFAETAASSTPITPAAQSDNYKFANPEEIEKYMHQARRAGPTYLEAAEKWLADIRKWQTVWGPFSGGGRSGQSRQSPVTPAAPTSSKMHAGSGPALPDIDRRD